MDGADESTWETTDRRLVHSCAAFEVYVEQVTLPDGTTTRFDYVSEPPSAVVLGFTVDDTVIVLREYRHAVGRVALGLPGGSAESEDADMAATARRELREEAGYRADGVEPMFTAEPANGLLDSRRHYFLAEGCERVADPDLDADETIAVDTMAYDTLVERVLGGEIHDERTVAAVAVHYGRHHDRTDGSTGG